MAVRGRYGLQDVTHSSEQGRREPTTAQTMGAMSAALGAADTLLAVIVFELPLA